MLDASGVISLRLRVFPDRSLLALLLPPFVELGVGVSVPDSCDLVRSATLRTDQ